MATQPGETTGFDLADHVEALERHTSSGIVDLVLANDRRAGRGSAIARRTVGDAVRLRWPPNVERPPRLVLDDLVDPADPEPSRPGPARRRDPPDRRARGRRSTRRGARPGPRRTAGSIEPGIRRAMSDADRDLVSAIRAELAAIVPQRACDRAAESAGLGAALATREAAVARLAVRLGREPTDAGRLLGGRRRTKHVRVTEADAGAAVRSTGPRAAEHCRIAWLRGRFLARGSLSLASGRAHLEFVVPRGRGAGPGRPPRASSGCPRRGGSGEVGAS